MAVVLRVPALLTGAFGGYPLLVRGALTLDLGGACRTRPLDPVTARIAAPPGTAFEVIAAPYLGKTLRAMRSGELGTDLWRLGQWWGDRVAAPWDRTVAASLESIRAEAERRSR